VSAKHDVIVVGLGAMGSAAACHLARRGMRVRGLDRFRPPHALGSSTGRSRIIRSAYFEHPSYVPLVLRAYALWDELAALSGRPLLRRTGGLMIGRPEGGLVSGARRSANLHGLPHELLDAAELRRRYPVLQPDADMVGVWEPAAGVLLPEDCIDAHLGLARHGGAALHFDEPVLGWQSNADGVQVFTDKGEYRATQLLLSAGAWIGALLPSMASEISVERQSMYWFAPRERAADFAPERCPIHLWEWAPQRYFYGFPDLGDGVKLAVHHEGERSDPDQLRRSIDAAEIAAMRELVERYVPAANGALRTAEVCMYGNTRDEHFWIDRVPGQPQVLVASPCSGHGFKFASVIGEVLADLLIDGRTRFDLALFKRR
jgi:sarcosine oxidase